MGPQRVRHDRVTFTSLSAGGGDTLSAAESHPMSEVRDSGLECQAAIAQEWPRGDIPHLRSGVTAGRRYPVPEARAVTGRSNPTPKTRGGGWEE